MKIAMQEEFNAISKIFWMDRGTTRCSIRLPGTKMAENDECVTGNRAQNV
jgi:hypothetical protein